ncbi:MAG: GAF domain-containing protein [Magnetospirillum sp.]|nr:GAF domain-containing protein [Magnetospirillum sp.]
MHAMVDWLHEPARRLHDMIRDLPGFTPMRHVSISLYDSEYDMLWAFSCMSATRPEITEIEMTDAPSLVLLADSHEPRVIDDLSEFGDSSRHHTVGARNAGSRSCMTVPISMDGCFLGFVNFGAALPGFFTAATQEMLMTFAEAFGILMERAHGLSE